MPESLPPRAGRRAVRPSLALLAIVALTAPLVAEESVDKAALWRIRQEATERSQIMETLHVLTDVYGPRLTGSPQLEAANRWVIDEVTRWGLANARVEPWTFGHPGWQNDHLSVHMTSPVKDALVGEVLAWTPSTNGVVSGAAVQIEPPDRPTQDELTAFLKSLEGVVAGKIVLVGRAQAVPVQFNPPAKRREESELRSQFDPINPSASPFAQATPPAPDRSKLTAQQVNEQVDAWLVAQRALVRFNDAGREHGQIRAFNNRTFDLAKAVPTVVLRNEDFGRISRLLAHKRQVSLEVAVTNQVFPAGTTAYNVVAEIPGTDKASEVVMLGGHIDSWHAATGATDNAIGVATMMEAVRIIKTLGLKPRRTIRLALWSGEEQGLLGSRAYVAEHFGTFEAPKPEYDNFVAYLNIDSGTGRARGASVFGPAEAATVVREVFSSFADAGVVGTAATRSRRRGGTDHTSFNEAGLPGIGIQQDPIEYQTHTWHTNLDTYERIVPADAQASAAAIAAAVYHLAMRDEKLPRFTKDTMPAPNPPDPPATTAPTTAAPAARRP